MAQHDREIAQKDRCSVCAGSGWTLWPADQLPPSAKLVVCRECNGTGRSDRKGRKRLKPDDSGGE
jgi:DnaJ-class molecular chaperone